MSWKPLVYIAGPYTKPDPVLNTHKAIKAAEVIEELGCDVFIPHLSLIWHLVNPAPIEKWYARDLAVMHRCDALVRLPGESTGADAEVAAFKGPMFEWGIDIHHLRTWIKEWIDRYGELPDPGRMDEPVAALTEAGCAPTIKCDCMSHRLISGLGMSHAVACCDQEGRRIGDLTRAGR